MLLLSNRNFACPLFRKFCTQPRQIRKNNGSRIFER